MGDEIETRPADAGGSTRRGRTAGVSRPGCFNCRKLLRADYGSGMSLNSNVTSWVTESHSLKVSRVGAPSLFGLGRPVRRSSGPNWTTSCTEPPLLLNVFGP